jgi:hypothetical protein
MFRQAWKRRYRQQDNIQYLKTKGSVQTLQQGLLKQHFMRDGVPEDSLVFALLRQEYYS